MDDELLELQRQFEFAQQAKSSIRLSDRNVVELVQKLQELHIIDFELLHTVSGKEYITPVNLSLSLCLFRNGHDKLSDEFPSILFVFSVTKHFGLNFIPRQMNNVFLYKLMVENN